MRERSHAHRRAAPLLFIDACLVDPASGRDERGDCLVEDGVIAALGRRGRGPRAGGRPTSSMPRPRCSRPGLIDMRAFVGEPGAEHRETLASASRAAAAGGVTTVVCMPDTNPPIDDPAVVDFLVRRARDTADRAHRSRRRR